MLDIQREKFERRERLRAEGLSDEEIKRQLTQELKPFKPAFVNGKRVVNKDPVEHLETKPHKRTRTSAR